MTNIAVIFHSSSGNNAATAHALAQAWREHQGYRLAETTRELGA